MCRSHAAMGLAFVLTIAIVGCAEGPNRELICELPSGFSPMGDVVTTLRQLLGEATLPQEDDIVIVSGTVIYKAVSRGRTTLWMNGSKFELGSRRHFITVAPTGNRFASVSEEQISVPFMPGEAKVVVDSVERGWDEVLQGTPIFSPNGQRCAYAAREGGKWHVVVDGRESTPYESVAIGTLTFSPQSDHVAWVAKVDGEYHVFIDWVKGPPFDFIRTLSFSPIGEHWMYEARRASDHCIVLDDEICWEKGAVLSFPSWGPSEKLYYVVWRQSELLLACRAGRKVTYHELGTLPGLDSMDDHLGGLLWMTETEGVVAFSQDGGVWAARGVRGTEQFVVSGGVRGPLFKIVSTPVLSRDGKHLAYLAVDGGDTRIVLENQVLAIDGSAKAHVTYPLMQSGRFIQEQYDRGMLFVSRQRGDDDDPATEMIEELLPHFLKSYIQYPGPYLRLYAPPVPGVIVPWVVFSPDGGRLAYVIERDDREILIADGDTLVEVDRVLSPPIFSPDGNELAACVRDGEQAFVTVNGVRYSGYEDVGDLVFSGDSRHLAYVAREKGRAVAIVDGRRILEVDSVVRGGEPRFIDPQTLELIGIVDGAVYRFRQRLGGWAGRSSPHGGV